MQMGSRASTSATTRLNFGSKVARRFDTLRIGVRFMGM